MQNFCIMTAYDEKGVRKTPPKNVSSFPPGLKALAV